MPKLFWTLAATLTLAGCDGAPTAKDRNAATAQATPASAAASSFNPADACATLPKEKVAAIVGTPVTSAALSRVTPATADTAGYSNCTYGFAGGATLDFFARQSPIDDDTPEAIQRTKQAMIENMGAKPVDVPGLGTAAFSIAQMHQLHVFIGGNRYIYFMSPAPPAGKPIAEAELALAKAVIG